MTSTASPLFVALAELDLACTYAYGHPRLAIACCHAAIEAGIRARRPDITYRAMELLGAVCS